MPELDCIILETGHQPDTAVIWLHGLGADGNDFVPIIEQLQLPERLSIRFVFPNAPVRPITINQGYQMPGWYDISSLNMLDKEDETGIEQSSAQLKQLCEKQENAGITSDRIVLAGFSQGGAIALHCGTRYAKPLAGIMALSTYLPLADKLSGEISACAHETPVFMAQGRQDDVVAYQYAKRSMAQLQAQKMTVLWHEYDMGHAVCAEEIIHISQWLTQVL